MGAPIGNKNAAGSRGGKMRTFKKTKKNPAKKMGSYLKYYNSIRGRAEMKARDTDPRYKTR